MKYARVAVDETAFTFDKKFDYAIPEELETVAIPGCRVTVPFGRGNQKRVGFIFEVSDTTDDPQKVKKITEVLDDEPLLSRELISLAEFIKDRTFCTLYDAAKAMLPTGINHRIVVSYAAGEKESLSDAEGLDAAEKEFFTYLFDKGTFVKEDAVFKALAMNYNASIPEKLLKKGLIVCNRSAVRNLGDITEKMVKLCSNYELKKVTPKQKEVIKVLEDAGEASVKEICYFTGLTSGVISTLVKNGVCEFFEREVIKLPNYSELKCDKIELKLTDEQQTAYKKISDHVEQNKASVSLLYGVTGSGKTSVYVSVIDKVIASGKTVIVMVPEIGLTPQTIDLFCKRYGDLIAVFHSALSIRERLTEWKRVKSGSAKIVIGTRSAVFAPVENLGLIIIDEEQEHTYKSEATPRYSAIDCAKFRAAYNNCVLLLASATPSVESYANALNGKYELSVLSNRFGSAVLPKVITVDMRSEEKAVGSASISKTLYDALKNNLENKGQSILLINRRGYNTFAACNSCSTVICCPYCSISMTYHSANNRLMCHYCGHSVPFSSVCPECGENAVRYSGFGTQKIEDELAALLPDARIVRMDTDSTSGKNSHEKLLSAFANGEYDIMIGTQMVAKGLNFPNVTLVGVVSVDQQLYSDDFRSLEKTFSLLTQVVGRSGRGEREGIAIVQTLTPENEIIRLAAKQDYDAFFKTEIKLRKALVYPPYCDICVVSVTGESETKVKNAINEALNILKELTSSEYKEQKIIVLGPMPARVAKISNRYRHRLIIKCKNNANFRKMISQIIKTVGSDSRFSETTCYADINPDQTM